MNLNIFSPCNPKNGLLLEDPLRPLLRHRQHLLHYHLLIHNDLVQLVLMREFTPKSATKFNLKNVSKEVLKKMSF